MEHLIPTFKYHPNPVKTGNAIEMKSACICCNEERSLFYKKNSDEGLICFNCIADGRGYEKFGSFNDAYLDNEVLPNADIDEFEKRTPGYISWQEPEWLTHCGDFCEFHGDFEKQDLIDNLDDLRESLKEKLQLNEDDLKEYVDCYRFSHDNNPAIFKFVCRHCKKYLLHCDYT